MMVQFKKILPVLSILGAVLLWGSSFSAMRVLLKDLSPVAVMFCRMSIAFVFILPILKKNIPENYVPGDWKILLPMVLFQPCLYFLFETNALTFTTSSQAGIISACLPLMVALAAWLFLSEAIQKNTIFGLVLSISGVVLLTLFQTRGNNAPNPILGNFLEILAMASACGNMILVKKLSSRYGTWSLTCMQVCAGMVFFLPGIAPVLQANPSVFSLTTVFILIYLGVGVSFISFGLYNWGISKIDASKASIFINLIPVTAIILGWLVLGETLNEKQILAAGIVIAGVIISNRR